MRQFFLLKALFLLVFPVFGQNDNAARQAALDKLLAPKTLGANAPGFSVCVLERGEIVYEYQTGLANLETKTPITAQTIFNIGSVTKQFTAVCILLLEESGKLKRSDPVQQYLPELPDFGKKITLDHLLSHTSGLFGHVEVLNLKSSFKNERLNQASVFSFYQKYPVLAFEPGTDFAYNNTAYMLLAMVVERVSGERMEDFMDKNIFKPLGMQHARFRKVESDGLIDGTVSYAYNVGKKRYKKNNSTHNMMGATGVHCTLQDLARWQKNFEHNQLGKQSPELIQKMLTMYHLTDGTPVHYAAGLILKDYRGLSTIEHSGGWNSFLLQCRRFPAQGISILVASNNDQSSPFSISDAICDALLQFKPHPEKAASNLAQLPISQENLLGKYLSNNNRLRYIQRELDTLRVVLEESISKKAIALVYDHQLSSDTLLRFLDPVSDQALEFICSKDGNVKGFYWARGDYFYCRRFYAKLDEMPRPVKQWTGRYWAADYNHNVAIRRKRYNGSLKIKPVFFMGIPLDPITGSVYKVRGDSMFVQFNDDSFILGNEWVKNLKFTKRK